MKVSSYLCVSMVLFAFIATPGCKMKKAEPQTINLADLDTTANPADDFDAYANGGWKKNNPLPADRSRYGCFDQLDELGERQVRDLVKEISASKQESGSVGQKIADFYNSGMDTVRIEKEGINPLKPYLDKIDAIKDIAGVQAKIAELQSMGIYPGFAIYAAPDARNSSLQVTQIDQGGIGMPDRDYYTNTDARSAELRKAYMNYLNVALKLSGEPTDAAARKADIIMKMETRLAKASLTRLEQRDPIKTYNKLEIAKLSSVAPAFDWNRYFDARGIKNPGFVIASHPAFFTEFSKMFKDVSVEDWKIYLKWNVINDLATYLGKDFEAAHFDFFGKAMTGQQVMRPRWKRVLNTTSSALSEAIGQKYVAKYFPPEAKERMIKLVNNLKGALGERIKNSPWMSEATKKKAIEKLEAMVVKVGYPDKWRDYSGLDVKKDAYVLNVIRSSKFEVAYNLNKINKPVDKTEWEMPPQMVNAYYNPLANEIVFPAAILQPPFFFLNGDDAVNYGAIGVVIGHEMTHGFDDQGRLFDKNGNLTDWWTKEDADRFNQRAKVLSDQFDKFIVLNDVHADGKLTTGENIADLGGLNISFTALKKLLSGNEEKIDGFTPQQRFYLAFAHVWAQNIRDKEILRRTKEDVHSLGRFRVLGPLRNLPEFQNAFGVKPGNKMYLPESERAFIW
ncbi:MAG: M13 family metallopeptidase [Bacteroidota bacterium]|nr:M13 family metallopeptidase [Bacteroidota bacterium]